MNAIAKATAGFGFALFLLAAPAWSQTAPGAVMLAQGERDALDRWQKMSPEEKQEMRERFQRWKNLPPSEKEQLQN